MRFSDSPIGFASWQTDSPPKALSQSALTCFPAWDLMVAARRVSVPVMMFDGASESSHPLKSHQIWIAIQKYARDLPSTNEKVAVSGFCWGGGQTFSYAVYSDTIAAGFVFYGRAAAAPENIPKISAPIYGFYGESDNRINATIDATKAAADAANVTYEPVIYEGVGHAFLRRGMAEDANDAQKSATKAAWERWISLLQGL